VDYVTDGKYETVFCGARLPDGLLENPKIPFWLNFGAVY
jgi:hypothetical protein